MNTVTDNFINQLLPEIIELEQDEVDKLFQSAQDAYQALQKSTIDQRIDELKKVMEKLFENREQVVEQIMKEAGKTRTDALVSEVMGVLEYAEFLVENAKSILSDQKATTPITLMGKSSKIWYESLGVILFIAPWNYPLHIALTSIFGAFVAGNSIVYKPSEWTPLKGVLEMILAASPLLYASVKIAYGGGQTAQALIQKKPAKIFFTGSIKSGRSVLKQAAELLLPVDIEMGGKDPAIVLADVDLKRTVAGTLWGALTNTGQSCSSVEHIYVDESLLDSFTQQMQQAMSELTLNTQDQGDADIGRMTTPFQVEIIEQQLEDAISKGAKILSGGKRIDANSLFFQPTLVTDVTDDMLLMQEETFGPLVVIRPFKDIDSLIERLNQGEFGLSASVWSKDLKVAESIARRLQVGAVSINNVMLTEGNPHLPFGGTKSSGYGRSKGAEGLLGYARSKSIIVDKQSNKIEANWYPYTTQKYNLFNRFIDQLFSHSIFKLIGIAVSGLKLESFSQKKRGE